VLKDLAGGAVTIAERSRGLSLSHALSHRATSDPEGRFLLSEGGWITFGEADMQAEALAASMANFGIEAGDRVAIVLPECAEFAISVFALAKIRAVAVPLDPRLTGMELRYTLRHSGASCAIAVETFHGADYLQLFEEFLPVLPELHYLITVGEEDLWYDDRVFQFEDLVLAGTGRDYEMSAPGDADDLFAIVYTTGPSGKTKGVELTHANLIYAASATADAVGLVPGDLVVGVTALSHVFGLGPGLLGSVLAGSALALHPEFDPAESLDLIERHRATVHYGVPTVFASELREQRVNPRDLSSLRIGLVAGAPMPEALFREVEEKVCPLLIAAYSLTETSSTVAISRADDPMEKRRFTVGRPVEGTYVKVLDETGAELPVESLGELAVRGPGVMKGYYRQPKETAACLGEDRFFHTGDLGIIDEDGFIHLVGRRKGVILRGGSNVYPREIEERIHAHPAVEEVAVVGIQDAILGEAVYASVVPVEGAIFSEEELRDWCRGTLADYKIPDVIHFLEELPMTGTGKVRRVDVARLAREARRDPSL
jgi:fatty-acyl-CoA synthase